jgi:hypothetical protein
MMMASTPTSNNLASVLARLADRLDSLEDRLDRIKASAGQTIAVTAPFADSQEATKVPPFKGTTSTKGKGRANAPQASSRAKSAKKECPTGKAATLPNPTPLHLAQTFPKEGQTDRHLVTVVIPDASVQHVVSQGGKGLKQIHDISGARVNAYSLAGSNDEHHISIQGTNIQIGDALVVLGKQIARKKIRPPKMKKTGPSKGSSQSAPLLSTNKPPSKLPHHFTTQCSELSTKPRIVEVSTGEHAELSGTPYAPTVQIASPSPTSTPIVPSVLMGSPSPYMPEELLTLMQTEQHQALRREEYAARGLGPPELQHAFPSRGSNTA